MNLANAIYSLLKGAQYRGNVDDSTREQFDAIEWCDERPKPKWEAVEAYMAEARKRDLAAQQLKEDARE